MDNPAAPGAIGMGFPMTGSLTVVPPSPISAPAYADGLIDDVRVYDRAFDRHGHGIGPVGRRRNFRPVDDCPYTGDANLDGVVDGTDLNTVLSNYNRTGANWLEGEFSGSGTVDGGKPQYCAVELQPGHGSNGRGARAIDAIVGDGGSGGPNGQRDAETKVGTASAAPLAHAECEEYVIAATPATARSAGAASS